MSKKNEVNNDEKNSNYYDLKQDAVNELVDVLKNEDQDEEEDYKTSQKGQPNPYKIDKLSRIPTWIKAIFIKFWVAGAICYFFFWGLGYYIPNTLDLIVATGIAIGLITDLLINTAMLYFSSDKKEYYPYMLVPVSAKKIWPLAINIPVGLVEIFAVTFIYTLINIIFVKTRGLKEGTIVLDVEPILFGLFYVLVNMTIISIKNLIVKIVKRKKISK